MKRFLALFALLSLALALPALAPAKKKHKHASHHRTTVLKGSFRAIGADGAYTHRKFGKAQLVDNRKRDKLSVHLRRLAPRRTYTFALYSVPKGEPRCQEGASGGTQETAFAPKSKRTNKRGNLNAKQRSKTFKADRAKRYFVLVFDGADPVACAKLNGKKAKHCKAGRKHPGKRHGEKPAKGKREHPAHPQHPAKAKDEKPAKVKNEKPAKVKGEKPGKAKGHAAKRGCKRPAKGKGKARR
jgi:hypothetical protein